MGKGKVCVFLLLVVLALALVGLVAYFLFFATPRTDPKIQDAPHSNARLYLEPPSSESESLHVNRSVHFRTETSLLRTHSDPA